MAFNGTPLQVDMFSRYYASFFDEKAYITERTAAQSFFGRPETNSYTIFSPDAIDIDIDIARGNEKLANMGIRGTAGKFVGFGNTHQDSQIGQVSTFSRQFPLIEEIFNIGSHQLNARLPGEGPYEGLDKSARLRELGRRAYLELVRRTVRLQEVLAWQSLTLGVQSAQSLTDTTTNIYDYRRNSGNSPSLTHGWGNAAGTPLTDIDALADALLANGKLMPDGLVLGGITMRYLQANSQVSTNYANKLYFDLLQFGTDFTAGPEFDRYVAAGLLPYGRLRTPKGYVFTVFVLPYGYTNSSNVFTKYFNDTGAFMFSSQARADRFFGPAERIDDTPQEQLEIMQRFGFNPMSPPLPMNIKDPGNVVLPQQFYVDAYKSEDKKSITMRVQTAPIFATTQTDAFGFMTPGVAT